MKRKRIICTFPRMTKAARVWTAEEARRQLAHLEQQEQSPVIRATIEAGRQRLTSLLSSEGETIRPENDDLKRF